MSLIFVEHWLMPDVPSEIEPVNEAADLVAGRTRRNQCTCGHDRKAHRRPGGACNSCYTKRLRGLGRDYVKYGHAECKSFQPLDNHAG